MNILDFGVPLHTSTSGHAEVVLHIAKMLYLTTDVNRLKWCLYRLRFKTFSGWVRSIDLPHMHFSMQGVPLLRRLFLATLGARE